MIDNHTVQTLATKLDTGAITLAEAKAWLKQTYGAVFVAKTKDQLIRKVAAFVRAQGGAA